MQSLKIICLCVGILCSGAALAAPYNTIGATNSGVVIVSSTSGTVVYCPSFTYSYGTGPGLTVQPTGACAVLTGPKATPVNNTWQLLPVGANFFLVDKTAGTILQCAVSTYATNQVGGNNTVGACTNSGSVP